MDNQTFTIRPLEWHRSLLLTGTLVAHCSLGSYEIRKEDAQWAVSLHRIGTKTRLSVGKTRLLRNAKKIACFDHREELCESLVPACEVRRG